MTERDRDALGLSFDMLDVDMLNALAKLLEPDSVSPSGRVKYLRDLATRLEQAVKDIGVLRAENARLLEGKQYYMNVAAASEADLSAQRRANAALTQERDEWQRSAGNWERQADQMMLGKRAAERANAALQERETALESALRGLLAEPHGCPFCDSGKLRGHKPHADDCPFLVATVLAAAFESARKKIDLVCEHGTALDVHCCNCHSGFLFDADSCVCKFDDASSPSQGAGE